MAGAFLVGLDGSIATIALPQIGVDLHTTASQLQFVLVAYLVTGAALALPAGALGDRFGRKRLYLGGLALFSIGSLASAAALGPGTLIAARAIQGAGAAAIAALSLAMVTASVPRDEVGPMVGVWVAVTSAATAAGPLIGGALIGLIGWRGVFAINAPAAILVLLVSARELPVQPTVDAGGKVEWFGPVLLSAALILIALGVGASERADFASVAVLAPLAFGFLLIGALVWQQRATASPLVRWSDLSARPFPAALGLSVILGLALSGALYQLVLLLENVLRYSPATTGVVTLGVTAAFVIVSPPAGRLAHKVGVAPVGAVGLLLAAAGMYLLSRIGTATGEATVAGYLVLLGAGLGIALPAVETAAMAAVSPTESGAASGALNLASQIAAVLGISIIGGIALTAISDAWSQRATTPQLRSLRVAVTAGDITEVRAVAGPQAAQTAQAAYLSGASDAFLVGAGGLVLSAAFASFALRDARPTHRLHAARGIHGWRVAHLGHPNEPGGRV
jgi:EmrB/QacA subfamily drug resistance transporter